MCVYKALISVNLLKYLKTNVPNGDESSNYLFTIIALQQINKGTYLYNALSRKLKSRYGARNRFQEPSLELSSQAT